MKSNAFLHWFADHPTAANLLMLVLLFLGMVALPDIKRETLPDFTATEAEVTVIYPGASAEDVEQAVCQRIEDALDSVTDVHEVISEAREGLGRVVVEMRDGGDMQRFLSEVRTEVDAIDDFPDQAEDAVVRQLGRTDMVVSVAVYGPMSAPDLKLYCEQVRDRLEALPEVSQVDLKGFSDHQFRISVPAAVLRRHGLSLVDVARRVERMSVDLPAGVIETREADVLVRFSDERASVARLEDLRLVSGATGGELRLGDIGTVTDLFELDEERIVFNGQRAGMLQINKTKDEDTLRVKDAVDAFLERERAQAPPTVSYALTRDISSIVRDRLNLLTVNGLQGLVLVFMAMWLFFSFRFSFWLAMGLPVSFMGALFAMQSIGFSLNMITMVGLLMATGLLMDDAIVLSENMAAHMARGKGPLKAAVDGTAEVARGVLSSFATTVLIFGSVAVFMEGEIGKVLWVMPVVLILTLGVSLVEAFCILPNHLGHSLAKREGKKTPRLRKRFEERLEHFREKWLGRFVDWAVRWRYLFVGLVLAVFLASLGMVAGGRLKIQAFPDIEGDVIEARVLLPQGTPLWRTEAVAGRLVEALDRVGKHFDPLQPDGQKLVENVNVQYSVNADAYETGPHVVTVSVDLLGAEVREAPMDDITDLWRKETGVIPDVVFLNFKEPTLVPGGLAIDIRLQGRDLHELKSASMELLDWLSAYDGVKDLSDDLRPGKPEVRLRLKDGAMALGLDAADVASQLRAAFHGVTADEIQAGSESYEIDVQFPPLDQDDLGDLEGFTVTAPSGRQVPLTAVAKIEPGRGWARIARVDSVRTVTIRGDVDTRRANANEVLADTKASFVPGMLERHPGVRLNLEGQALEGAKTAASLRKAFLVGLFGVFVLLSFQFKSYIEPLVVMAAIPLALVGVVWGHIIMGLDLCMPSIMGFVSLAGVVVNDSILLVEFVKMRIRDGMETTQAATTASRQRFRAVLLTSLTTIAGLVPLLTERSLQAQILIPLATSIVFGLMASTALVLVVIPALYSILADFGLLSRHIHGHDHGYSE